VFQSWRATFPNRNPLDDDMIWNMVEAVTKNDLLHWVAAFDDPEKGFMWTESPHILTLSKETDSDGHSGASFAITLRNAQAFAQHHLKDDERFKTEWLARCIETKTFYKNKCDALQDSVREANEARLVAERELESLKSMMKFSRPDCAKRRRDV
jgi:hypothetical protein